jgi:asparagine synthase (glutamine-hydrolysing)
MCGFVGWLDRRPADQATLERMTTTLAHRGPDAAGYHLDGPIALGHRRLAVIDLAASQQPMLSACGRYALAYNGELYNFKTLRAELQNQGVQFRTNGDTEVLLQSLIAWGDGALPRLEGMFAFAFWDKQTESLLLARDPLGIKPLNIYQDDQRILFASELKAILAHPGVSRDIDLDALQLYLECQYIPAPFTIFKQIRKLQPARALRVQHGQTREWTYWNPSYEPKWAASEAELTDQLEAELKRSVSSMLVADVPLGAFVSGGIDSSLIAALMKDAGQTQPKIFNLGFVGNTSHSEHEYAARVAQHIGADHHPLMVQPGDVIDAFDQWVDIYDEPFGDQAALPTMLLSRLTRQHVTVALSGEGADEVFAGYSNYAKRLKEAKLAARLGHPLSPLPLIYPLLPAVLRKDRLIKAAARPLARRYLTIPNHFDRELHKGILNPALTRQTSVPLELLAEQAYANCQATGYLDKLLTIDQKLWLPDDLLTKVDRATMAYSLEARVPYLDHKLVEFAARLPANMKLHGRDTKYLLKKVAERYLPHDIVYRGKQGFVMPLHEWLAGGLKTSLTDMLGVGDQGGLGGRNIFRAGFLDKLQREQATPKQPHGGRLWTLMVLELWFRRYAPDFKL